MIWLVILSKSERFLHLAALLLLHPLFGIHRSVDACSLLLLLLLFTPFLVIKNGSLGQLSI